jgi:tetratricopeptide (TPR) repeat protein
MRKIPSIRGLMITSLVMLTWTWANAAVAPAAGLEGLANEIARAMNKSRGDAVGAAAKEEAKKLQGLVWQIGDSWKDGNLDGVEHGLRSMIEQSPSESIAEQARALLAHATAEKEQRNTRFLGAVEDAMKLAAEVCAKAKSSSELDAGLGRIQSLVTSGPRAREVRVQRAMEQARGASRFLKKWQEYLAANEARNFRNAAQILEQFSDDAVGNSIVPRSEVLARIQTADTTALKEQAPAQMAQSIHTVDDVLRTLDGMKTSRRWENNSDGSTQRFFAVLKHFQMGWLELKGGNAAKAIDVAANSFEQVEGIVSSEVLEAFARVQRDLLLRALPVTLNLSAKNGPAKDEKPADYLVSLLKEASAGRDWLLMTRVLEVYGKISGGARRGSGSSDWLSVEKQALNHFIIAQNQEKAGDFDGALRSYEAALRLPSHYLPAEQIGESVGKLKGLLRDRQLPAVEK